jgi:tetratricopeptide (TPR) repeat protein
MRASLLLESDPSAAAQRASDILAGFPEHPAAGLLLATARRRLGDPGAAARLLESLAGTARDSPVVQLELGRCYAAAGRNAEATSAFRRAVALDAGLADGWRELATQLHGAGETLEGDRAYVRYCELSPEPPELGEAVVALRAERVPAAEALLRERLRQAPRDVVALRMLADAARRREDDAEAERRLEQCLELAPGFGAARYDLARLLNDQQRIEEMLPHVERLLACDPGNVDCLNLKAQGLRLIGRRDESVALMEQLLADHPDEEQSLVLFGGLFRELGQSERAIEMFRRALRVHPGSAAAYSSLANLKTYRFDSGELAAMQQQLALPDVRGSDRIYLEFALGKGLEDTGEFAGSFEHYARGNRLQRAAFYYDARVITAEVEHSRSFYAARFFGERSAWGSERPDPIFIIGMPRSGSTLLEQMLASHSQVEGTRELFDLPHLVFELVSGVTEPTETTLLERISALSRAEIEAFAQRYLERVQHHRPLGKARFIDKLPGNWCYVGLIHLLFPRAAIVDARRHPLGCGFSCYKQLFARGQKYSYDLGELGRFYRDYASLMDHFDATLPGRVHRVYYEQLVADPERELRRLLEYCGLPFEEQCLRFYENRRAVTTISAEQVRRPIYGEGVDHWRHYEPWLGPLNEIVGELVARYPAPAAPASGNSGQP